MDKKKGGFFLSVYDSVRSGLKPRGGFFAFVDIANLLLALVFARCHLIFGAHPIGFAYIAVLPEGVWMALLGAVIGSFTLGREGVIYAMISVIIAFLRIIVSGGEPDEGEEGVPTVFREGLLLRMSAALIGGFIAAIYEILLSGFTFTGVLFGLTMIIAPPFLVFLLSGLFDTGPGIKDLILSDKPPFSLAGKNEKQRFDLIFFQGAALVFMFLISLALRPLELLGINAAYLFSAAVTLVSAKRFGSTRAAAVGFASSFAVSGLYAAAFSLLGLAAGALFKLGTLYAVIGGGGVICAWAAYAGGTLGFLSTFPEYAIAASVIYPFIKKLSAEKTEKEEMTAEKCAQEMVGTMALSYKAKRKSHLDTLESSLSAVSGVIRERQRTDAYPTEDELRGLTVECVRRYLLSREDGDIAELKIDTDGAAKRLYEKGIITPEELVLDCPVDEFAEGACQAVNRAAAILREEKFKSYSKNSIGEEMDLIAKMIGDGRERDSRECRLDEALSERLCKVCEEEGLVGAVVRVFGQRRKKIILAAEDERGTVITSPSLLAGLSRESGLKLSRPEFFRRGKMALMECAAEQGFRAECATASAKGTREEVSGDTARHFESRDGRFYSLICDGMGSGALARDTSTLVCDLLVPTLDFGGENDTVIRLVNKIIRSRMEECSATVDLFSFDLFLGEGYFIKSGAAPSYIKRKNEGRGGDSIFRIRSKTAPIGLMREVDAEKIKVELKDGDVIVMLSDGIMGAEEGQWLVQLLSRPIKCDLKAYAELILEEAAKNVPPTDDMTVAVTRLSKI